jgi:hypothetical protein
MAASTFVVIPYRRGLWRSPVYSTHASGSKHAYDAETNLLRRFVARRAVLAAAGGGLDGELAVVERGAQRIPVGLDAPTRAAQLQVLLEVLVAYPTDEWVRDLAKLFLAQLDAAVVRDCDG